MQFFDYILIDVRNLLKQYFIQLIWHNFDCEGLDECKVTGKSV